MAAGDLTFSRRRTGVRDALRGLMLGRREKPDPDAPPALVALAQRSPVADSAERIGASATRPFRAGADGALFAPGS